MFNLYSIIVNNNNYLVITLELILIFSLFMLKIDNLNKLIIMIIGLTVLEGYYDLQYLPFLIFINAPFWIFEYPLIKGKFAVFIFDVKSKYKFCIPALSE